ncbi:Integral membrane protein [Mycena kentingensis (nom. inval.)]|nr:Integral membrane protein [Mycena kentingensis (nom. inval.)]
MFVRLLKTVALFSKSDVIPILGPSLAVAMVLGGPTEVCSFVMGFLWLELHLLTFEVIGLEEDRLSKPYRPIACGRISVASAERLYILVGVCALAWSAYHDLLVCSAVYMLAIYAYNECAFSRHWFFKSFLGAVGYVCYCWGTTSIFDHGNALSTTSIIAIAASGLMHVTTGHAQDFRDISGDAAIGRTTLPMLLPSSFARWSLALLLALWTLAHTFVWSPPVGITVLFAGLAAAATVRFVLSVPEHEREKADGAAYWWYNMWLITAHMLPLCTPARLDAWRIVGPSSFLAY